MALYHRATITPSKPEVVAAFAADQPWCDATADEVEVVGAFRFDDPLGRVGMESFVARAGDGFVFVPLTYRDEPLESAADALITTVEHSVLGTRWVYDGLGDPLYVTMLTAVSMTGQGEALGMVEVDGRWIIAPTNLRVRGGGWTTERIPLDRMALADDDRTRPVFRNDGFEMAVSRTPAIGEQPAIGLTATWPELDGSIVLTSVVALG